VNKGLVLFGEAEGELEGLALVEVGADVGGERHNSQIEGAEVGREDGPALELLDGEVGVEGHELVLRQELVEECVGVGEEVVVGFFVGESVGVGEVLDGREGRLDEAPGGLDVHEVP